MSGSNPLQNSYGPEAVPNQTTYQPPLEYYGDTSQYKQLAPWEKTGDAAPEVVVPPTTTKDAQNGDTNRKRILGLPVAAFWIVVALIILIVLGIGIGVGVGVGLKNANAQPVNTTEPPSEPPLPTPTGLSSTGSQSATTSSSSSSTRSSTTGSAATAAVTSGTHGLADNSCNFTAPRTYHAGDDVTFVQYCFTDWPTARTRPTARARSATLRGRPCTRLRTAWARASSTTAGPSLAAAPSARASRTTPT